MKGRVSRSPDKNKVEKWVRQCQDAGLGCQDVGVTRLRTQGKCWQVAGAGLGLLAISFLWWLGWRGITQ